jgi:hydantoinase/carbamoylase family amidase
MSVHERIAVLAQLNADPDAGGITREVFTPLYTEATALVAEWMRDAGLTPRVDAFGNLFGRREGTDPGAPAVLSGSHFDTTLNAGRYDGVVGVLGAIEAAARLRDAGLRHPLEVVGFAGEEPRFASGCIGSRALVGALSRADLDTMLDRDGISIAAAQRAAGLDPDRIADARLDPTGVRAFVELHIEQGAVLESAGLPIGVVTAIAAPHDLAITVHGKAAHAGATPMRLRRDAVTGAAEVALALEQITLASPSGTTVGTIGVVRARPGAINVIAGEVELRVDIRDSDLPARQATMDAFLAAVGEICARRGLTASIELIVRDTPVTCAPDVVAAATAACESLGVAYREMTSGAYHDAMILAREVPVGMIFVPSRDGLSHHPDEYTAAAEIDRGIDVLTGTLERLAS